MPVRHLQYIIYQLESVNATQHPFIVLHPGLLYLPRKSVSPFWSKILSIKGGRDLENDKLVHTRAGFFGHQSQISQKAQQRPLLMVERGKTMFSTWSDKRGQFDRKMSASMVCL